MSTDDEYRNIADPTTLGNLAILWGNVSEEDVQRALAYQLENPASPLGEALVACGIICRKQLGALLQKQKELRSKRRASIDDLSKLMDMAQRRADRAAANITELLLLPDPPRRASES